MHFVPHAVIFHKSDEMNDTTICQQSWFDVFFQRGWRRLKKMHSVTPDFKWSKMATRGLLSASTKDSQQMKLETSSRPWSSTSKAANTCSGPSACLRPETSVLAAPGNRPNRSSRRCRKRWTTSPPASPYWRPALTSNLQPCKVLAVCLQKVFTQRSTPKRDRLHQTVDLGQQELQEAQLQTVHLWSLAISLRLILLRRLTATWLSPLGQNLGKCRRLEKSSTIVPTRPRLLRAWGKKERSYCTFHMVFKYSLSHLRAKWAPLHTQATFGWWSLPATALTPCPTDHRRFCRYDRKHSFFLKPINDKPTSCPSDAISAKWRSSLLFWICSVPFHLILERVQDLLRSFRLCDDSLVSDQCPLPYEHRRVGVVYPVSLIRKTDVIQWRRRDHIRFLKVGAKIPLIFGVGNYWTALLGTFSCANHYISPQYYNKCL